MVCWHGGQHRLRLPRLAAGAEGGAGVTGTVTAPMPGRIVAVAVREGDTVAQGARLLVLEAMKMEHTLTAPAAGRVSAVRCAEGEQVSEGTVLVVIEPEEAAA
ncbi:acetyl-CoA carboxylase biotin carboxyl carrier protein subunit [Inmirania thermothiophila]|uniref:acetyl-CoA carboxylase biotin carboxyl carrier protein subunit n=1 Tax=Inmirania thermothiophila TaxID=1750597 RepID=UPI003CCC88A7